MSGVKNVVRRVNIRVILPLLPPYLQVAICRDPVRQVNHRDRYCFFRPFFDKIVGVFVHYSVCPRGLQSTTWFAPRVSGPPGRDFKELQVMK